MVKKTVKIKGIIKQINRQICKVDTCEDDNWDHCKSRTGISAHFTLIIMSDKNNLIRT